MIYMELYEFHNAFFPLHLVHQIHDILAKFPALWILPGPEQSGSTVPRWKGHPVRRCRDRFFFRFRRDWMKIRESLRCILGDLQWKIAEHSVFFLQILKGTICKQIKAQTSLKVQRIRKSQKQRKTHNSEQNFRIFGHISSYYGHFVFSKQRRPFTFVLSKNTHYKFEKHLASFEQHAIQRTHEKNKEQTLNRHHQTSRTSRNIQNKILFKY